MSEETTWKYENVTSRILFLSRDRETADKQINYGSVRAFAESIIFSIIRLKAACVADASFSAENKTEPVAYLRLSVGAGGS